MVKWWNGDWVFWQAVAPAPVLADGAEAGEGEVAASGATNEGSGWITVRLLFKSASRVIAVLMVFINDGESQNDNYDDNGNETDNDICNDVED